MNGPFTTVLVGIAGSYNAMSLSLYNLKAYALVTDPELEDLCDIRVLQRPLIAPGTLNTDRMIDETVDLIVAAHPQLVGFSVYMWNVDAFVDICDDLRERLPGLRIVMGGPEVASDYIRAGEYDDIQADFLVYGEGERTFHALLRHLVLGEAAIGEIPGLAHRTTLSEGFTVNAQRSLLQSISELPSPYLSGIVDEEVLQRHNLEANLETQRGCTLKCSYCIYHKDMPKIAYNTVQRIVDEAKFVNAHGVKRVRFVDANFTSDLPFAKEVMRGLIDAGIQSRLMFELIPGFIDEEIVELFAEYERLCDWNELTIGVGVQTINYEVLKSMRRGIKMDRFVRTFDLLSKHSIYTKIDLIIGLPGEDIDSISRTLEYFMDQLRKSSSHLLCCHTLRGLPGTELIEIARRHGQVFSSEREPHELIESPALPRSEMLMCLRRTAMIFRLVNHEGWVGRAFVFGQTDGSTVLRDRFFQTRERLGATNLQLIDALISKIGPLLPDTSWFVQPDFPYAETWWWNHSATEIRQEWLVNELDTMSLPDTESPSGPLRPESGRSH